MMFTSCNIETKPLRRMMQFLPIRDKRSFHLACVNWCLSTMEDMRTLMYEFEDKRAQIHLERHREYVEQANMHDTIYPFCDVCFEEFVTLNDLNRHSFNQEHRIKVARLLRMAHLYAYPENYYNSPAQAEENQELESAHADSHVFPLLCLPDKVTKEVLRFMHASQVVQFNMTCTQLCSESQREAYQCVRNLRHVVALVRKYETRVFEERIECIMDSVSLCT